MDTNGIEVSIVQLETEDNGKIEVAVSPITRSEANIGIIHIHGKGGNFYGFPFRSLVPLITEVDIIHLSVNMRCHDLGYTRTDLPWAYDTDSGERIAVGGGMWEDLTLGSYDIGAAVRYARDLGCDNVFLIGHSSGAFYAPAYSATDPSIAGQILLSPLTTNKTSLASWFPSQEELEAAVVSAESLVAAGQSFAIIPLDAWYYGISAKSLLQRVAEPDGEWESNIEMAGRPTLVMWGSCETRGPMFRRLVNKLSIPNAEAIELPGSDHNYIGFEASATQHILSFIRRNLTAVHE